MEYTITTRQYESQKVGYKRDTNGDVKLETLTKEIPDVHTCEFSNGKFNYYLDDCYTNIVTTTKLDNAKLDNGLPVTHHSHFVNSDHISVGFSPNLDKVSLENTAMVDVTDLKELKEIRLKDLFTKKYKVNGNISDQDIAKISVHGSLGFRMLYRLNSRMPVLDTNDNKIKGLKSVNRMNVIEDELVVSMWQNVRTVPAVTRKVQDLDSEDKTNNSLAENSLHAHPPHQLLQVAFADRTVVTQGWC